MKWNKGSSRYWSMTIPGAIPVRCSISVYSESIVAEIRMAGCTVRKECFNRKAIGVDEVKRVTEGALNELAAGIWEA
ncbi:MAG: hypothetical protein IAA72_08710 [Spirochaetes bacterium]|uniref:Uncharacterized protein n=1 Tax=Candidatus Ornithospirochaeta stercoravium TaxID=2840897 RepID=A0A9D9NE20_9SPIO|nr:hypothetical protein [Candidatus Ornithospirochaeta stercoravium]